MCIYIYTNTLDVSQHLLSHLEEQLVALVHLDLLLKLLFVLHVSATLQ